MPHVPEHTHSDSLPLLNTLASSVSGHGTAGDIVVQGLTYTIFRAHVCSRAAWHCELLHGYKTALS